MSGFMKYTKQLASSNQSFLFLFQSQFARLNYSIFARVRNYHGPRYDLFKSPVFVTSCLIHSSKSHRRSYENGHNRFSNSVPLKSFSVLAILFHSIFDRFCDNHNSQLSFPMLVQCSETRKPILSEDRLSSIKALDVVADVAQEVQPGVVSITSTRTGFLSPQSRSSGSGFIVDDLGHVVTNAHVVSYRGDVFVHLADGRSFPGRVLAVDLSSDLAFIKMDVTPQLASTLPRLSLASNLKKVRPGNFVLALGSPLMLANSVTVGVVSAVDRDLGHSEGLKYIQTDAIITFGNSGGPLVNLYGEVIGINTMVAGTGVGFAIPMDQVRKFISLSLKACNESDKSNSKSNSYLLTNRSKESENTKTRRYLGLVMRTLTPELAIEFASRGIFQSDGVLIHAVLQNSPAERAGLKAGDIIIFIDGLPVTNAQQVYAATESREKLTMVIVREGRRITIENIATEKV